MNKFPNLIIRKIQKIKGKIIKKMKEKFNNKK